MKQFFIFLLLLLSHLDLVATDVNYINLDQVCKTPYTSKAILRQDALFIDDFLTLHCLVKIASPQTLFEIGTCTGEGTLIIKNAIGSGTVYSLDLPPGTSFYDLHVVGEKCYLPFVQIYGNSMTLNYSDYFPIEAWFIDGMHEYAYVLHETKQALTSNPKIIIWHDSDIPEILDAIRDGLENSGHVLYRINGTRVAFSVPATSLVNGLVK